MWGAGNNVKYKKNYGFCNPYFTITHAMFLAHNATNSELKLKITSKMCTVKFRYIGQLGGEASRIRPIFTKNVIFKIK